MKAIIYTGSTGAGHTLAAYSLKNALDKDNNFVEIIDAFEEGGDLINTTVTKGYQRLVENLPKLYRLLYNEFDSKSKVTESVLKRAAKILKKDILGDIEEYKPDIIISTHPIVTNILGRLKDNNLIDKPILSFVTDYKVHDIYLKDSIDAYVVGSDYTKQTMIDRGVPEEKVFNYGIPIREEFRKAKEKHPKDNTFKVLLMAGSLGSRQLKKAFISLLKSNSNLKITVVCGKNKHIKKVLKQINKKIDHDKEVNILGFTDKISDLMEESDTIITKPGGSTSTEAISKNIPIIIPYTYPGQEEDNAHYLEKNGMAIMTKNIHELANIIDNLAQNPKIITTMSKSMHDTSKNYSIDKTVELCEQLALN